MPERLPISNHEAHSFPLANEQRQAYGLQIELDKLKDELLALAGSRTENVAALDTLNGLIRVTEEMLVTLKARGPGYF